jgi:hypothetical protein
MLRKRVLGMAYNQSGSIENMSTENIRAEPNTYPELFLKALNRIIFLAGTLVEKNDAHAIAALETTIRGTDCLVVHMHTDSYRQNVSAIQKKLLNMDADDKEYSYVILPMGRFTEICKLAPRMGLIPATNLEEYEIASSEEIEAEKIEKAKSYLKKILKEKGAEGITELVSELTAPPKPEEPRPIIKISDIIDKSYLSKEDLE